MPGQVCDQSGVLVAAKIPREEDGEEKGSGLKVERADRAEAGDCNQEEDGDGTQGDMAGPRTTEPPSQHLAWRVDLAASEPHWQGWFQGLSQRFLDAPAAKMLLLAGVDRLDKELTVGQMQILILEYFIWPGGKMQMII